MKFNSNIYNYQKLRMAAKGFEVQKWVEFCQYFYTLGLDVRVHESKSTFSKYVYIRKGRKVFKVRFSNHKPNKLKQRHSDCDFYVGISHGVTTTTKDAIIATKEALGLI